MPESTRWLIAKGRIDEAMKNIQNRAAMNGTGPVPHELLGGKFNETKSIQTKRSSVLDLFKPRQILLRSLIMYAQWGTVTMVYYGLLFVSTSLSGDPYLNFTLVVLAELPGIFIYLKAPDLIGRRNTLAICQGFTLVWPLLSFR